MRVGGETSDRFTIVGPNVTGGMCAVHRALDRRTGELVALKLLLPERPEHAARLAAEAEALAALDHPAVVRLIAHGTTPQGQPFLAMEWLDGEDLAARLERGRLSPPETATLGLRVAQALAAVHARGIVHRDVKPANLFLPAGRLEDVKVLDFGIARVHGRRALTATGEGVGTPGYVAPEQASGAEDIDARADVFSLGAVLYECLTGRPPFFGEHPLAALAKILLEDVPPVGELCPGAPPALAGLVDRMLAKDRGARPASAAAVAEALSSLLDALPPEEHGPPASEPAPQPEETLANHERRLMTVLIVQPAEAGGPATAPAGEEREGAPSSSRRLRDAVAPLGGRTEQVSGGATLVTWTGAEGPREQAARAARCALLVRRMEPEAAIAIAGGLGDAQGLPWRPAGQALDRATAMLAAERREPTGRIRIDGVVARLLDARFRIAGGSEGMELLGEEDFGDGGRRLLGRPTPFVGRDREVRALRDLFEECVSESVARAVLVTGPIGVGKSRLREELVRGLRQTPHTDAWLARGDCMSAGAAFATVASALRSTSRVSNGEPLPTARRKIAGRIAEHVPPAGRDRVAAFLGELAGVPFPDESHPLLGPARQSPARMADQIRRAWLDFVAAECGARPVVIVIEDLHWTDTPSVQLLDATLDHLRDRPFFVLALGRPEVHDVFPRLWSRRGAKEIRLDGLGRRAAEQLVRHVLGPATDGERIAQIVSRASGNAFYLEELIRVASSGEDAALPETVLAVVQARLDALARDERRVLRAASVFGESFRTGGVAALLGGSERVLEVESLLETLLAQELLVSRDGGGSSSDRELGFRHALVRDGAYAGLTEADRALAHGSAATWLEASGEDDAVVLAAHFDRAGRPERASRYHVVAARRALVGNDARSAIEHAERSLPAGEDGDLRLERAQILAEAWWLLGDLARVGEHAGGILKLAPAGSSPWLNAIAVLLMVALERGDEEGLTEHITALMGAEMSAESPELLVRLQCTLVIAFCLAGIRELAAYFVDCMRRGPQVEDPTTSWFVHAANGLWSFFFEADFWAASLAHERALALSERAGLRRFDAFSHALLGWSWAALGALDRAEHELRRALELSAPGGLGKQIGRTVLSFVLTQRGAYDEALAEARTACEAARGAAFTEATAWAAVSYAHLVLGEIDEADRAADLALSRLSATPMLRTMALLQVALVRFEQGRFDEALRVVREALGSDEPCRAHPFVELRLRAAEVEALEALGDAEGARAARARTHRRVREFASRVGDEAIRAGFLEQIARNSATLRLPAPPPG